MPVAVDGCHAPEVHVSYLQGVASGHGQRPVGRAEVAVDPGINPHLSQPEIFVRGEFKHDVVARGRLSPVEGRLGVPRKIVS